MKGALWVAYGASAKRVVKESVASFKEHNSRVPTKVLTESAASRGASLTIEQQAHWAKTHIIDLSPFDPTLLIDADTLIKGSLTWGFGALSAGWEIVLVPSVVPDGAEVLWNLAPGERRTTLDELGAFNHVMFNTGILYFKKTPRVRRLFTSWQQEWLRFRDRDQGAFLRALRKNPVLLLPLGYPYNSAGGEVVDHLFGRAR